MNNWIESRVTSVIRKAEIFSENGEHETADNWLDNMLTELELQSERLRDAQNQIAVAALRRKERLSARLNPEPRTPNPEP